MKSKKAKKIETTKAETFETGATRVPVKEAFHLVCPELARRVALISGEGLASYPLEEITEAKLTTGSLGLPLSDTITHLERHYAKWRNGDRTEDHLAKVAWAIGYIMHGEAGAAFNGTEGGEAWTLDHPCEHERMLVNAEHKQMLR